MIHSYDYLIAGGGIIGLITARKLSLAGFKVVLADKQQCSKESSWAGAGIITPLYPWKYSDFVNELSIKSQKQYGKLCQELLENTNIDSEYINSGLLMLDEFDSDNAQQWLNNQGKKWGINYKLQDGFALFNNYQVRNSKILPALKKDLKIRGVDIFENHKINLTYHNNKAYCKNIAAKNIIICTGSWSAEFGVKIYPVRGQIITLQDNSKQIKNIILKNGKYIVPRKDGVILIGSTMEKVGFDRNLSTKSKNDLLDFAIEIFPHLKKCQITNHWCGFRPGSDGDPIIKKSEQYTNLFYNCGHFRNGLNTAIASADLILDIIK